MALRYMARKAAKIAVKKAAKAGRAAAIKIMDNASREVARATAKRAVGVAKSAAREGARVAAAGAKKIISIEKLRVKKRSGQIQRFMPEKIREGIMRAGGSRQLAEDVANDVMEALRSAIKVPVITFKVLAKLVMAALNKRNPEVAARFQMHRQAKLKKHKAKKHAKSKGKKKGKKR